MKRSALISSTATCLCLALATPAFAADAPAVNPDPATSPTVEAATDPTPAGTATPVAKPAAACLADVRAFNVKLRKNGYWLGASDYGYGYPMGGYGLGYPVGGYQGPIGYGNARPGYEVRNLIESANIVAQHGQQQACEDILATTQAIYQQYSSEMQTRGVTMDGGPDWRLRQIATAQPVLAPNAMFRSDQLLDTDVSSPQGEPLGSVHDIVMSPQTGKIAYLVIARGGIFGIDEKYVPVPWADFKATPSVNLLVLNTTKAVLKAAPQVSDDHFAAKGGFDKESQLVDAYWNAQPQSKLSDAGTVSP